MATKKCKYCNGTGKQINKSIGDKKKFHMNAFGNRSVFFKYGDNAEACHKCMGTGLRNGARR